MKLIYIELTDDQCEVGTRLNKAPIVLGDAVHLGDNVFTSRGEKVIVNHFAQPHKPSSSGKISVQHEGDTSSMEYYVGVIGAKWIDREDQM